VQAEVLNRSIDWFNDDGINIGMISDVSRNKFYNSALKETKNKKCIDVGFGTGLLSIMALKNGAIKILAYEKNELRYHIGKSIIEKLNLSDRIDLINESFIYDENVHKDYEIIFHEIIGCDLYNEGVKVLINTNTKTIPSSMGTDFYFLPIDENKFNEFDEVKIHNNKLFKEFNDLYTAIKDPSWPECNNYSDFFNLPDYIKQECIDDFNLNPISLTGEFSINTGISDMEDYENVINQCVTFWQEINTTKSSHTVSESINYDSSDLIVFNNIDFNQKLFNTEYIDNIIPSSKLTEKYYYVKCRHYLEHNQNRIYLEDNHWGSGMYSNSIIKNTGNDLIIRQYYDDGKIKYLN